MKKILVLVVLALFLFNLGLIYAHTEETFALAEEIIKQKTPCENLTEEQIEFLGDYYMEQMHPEELHEIMDERMGGEGSESLRQVHINMGLAFYCGERGAMSVGMMNTMMGRGMMGYSNYGGMMGNAYYRNGKNIFNIFWWITIFLIIFVLVLFITWLIKQLKQKHEKG